MSQKLPHPLTCLWLACWWCRLLLLSAIKRGMQTLGGYRGQKNSQRSGRRS